MDDYEKLVKELDKSDVRSRLKSFHEQITKGVNLGKDISIIEEINKIMIFGMGGSALPGKILKQYLQKFHIPIFVVEDYEVPNYLDNQTLAFVISYSGNTEETISAYRQSVKAGAKVISITSGGKLKDLCEFNKTRSIIVPSGYVQREAYGLMFFPMLQILVNSKLIDDETGNIKKLIGAIKNTDFESMGKKLATRIANKTPIIYSSNKLKTVAWKWKINFNETSKTDAFYNTFPELNHNELNSYENFYGDYYVLILKDSEENPKIIKRINLTKKILKEKGIQVTEIGVTGNCYLTRLFSALIIGDWTSYHLAIMYEKDPADTGIIEGFKEDLKKL